jgi:hypothetical protein
MPATRIFDAEGTIDDYRDYRLSEGKAKGPGCSDCDHEVECEGVWREYTERYGFDELKSRHN